MILEARTVDYLYDDGTRALNSVSLAVDSWHKLAILGSNGAGKSTLLSILNGSFKPSAGAVLLNGKPVTYSRKGLSDLRSQVGLVLQDPDDQLFAATVFEDVSFGPLNLGLSKDEARVRVLYALEAMGISALSDRPTHLLSFGQRKRAAIAGVLAMSPSVILLDEPTAGLDPKGVEDLIETLDVLAAKGVAVVVATHDMDMAYAWADTVAVFDAGKILLHGTPDEVFGSDGFLASSDLRLPVIYQVARGLQAAGLLPLGAAMPRRLEELLDSVAKARAVSDAAHRE